MKGIYSVLKMFGVTPQKIPNPGQEATRHQNYSTLNLLYAVAISVSHNVGNILMLILTMVTR